METIEKHTMSASAKICAPASVVYSIIANYRDEHGHILPPQFSDLVVDEGGIGAGTVIRFKMRLLGRTQSFRAAVSEPDPGRVLVETYLDPNTTVTTFIVDSGPAPGHSQVTIATDLPVRDGLLGKVERFLSTKLLLPVYARELELLADRATRLVAIALETTTGPGGSEM
jgi:hypothetical protein